MKKVLSTRVAPAQPENWVVTQHEYEGFPLFTRYPNNLDYDKLQEQFPVRVVVTIDLSEVTDKGLPVTSYNNSLESFDNFVVESLADNCKGQCVLVETFSGERHFYIYASDSADTSELEAAIKNKFPQHVVSFEVRRDPKWSFIRQYAKDYLGGG